MTDEPRPRMRAFRVAPSPDVLTAEIIGMAKANGCDCDPVVRLPNRAARRKGTVTGVAVMHDDDCTLLRWIEGRPVPHG